MLGAGAAPPIDKPKLERRKPPVPVVAGQETAQSSAAPVIPQGSDSYKRIADRVAKYDAKWHQGLKPKAVNSGNRTVPRRLPEAITRDPNLDEAFQDPAHWFQIDDYPPLEAEAIARAEAEGNPVDPSHNHYMNMYHDTGKAAVMMENFRHRYAEYFASDAFFSQWMRVMETGDLKDLPSEFPSVIYRNHIENTQTLEAILALGNGTVPNMNVEVGSEAWNRMKGVPNVKTTLNMMHDFNAINLARGRFPKFKCVGLQIYQGPTLKFMFAEDNAAEPSYSH